jgi:hypothetical protein
MRYIWIMPNVQYLALRLFFEKAGPEGVGMKNFKIKTQCNWKAGGEPDI